MTTEPLEVLFSELREVRSSIVRIEQKLYTKRRELSVATRLEHIETIAAAPFDGLCPCCLLVPIVEGSERIPDRSEYDHWHQPHLSDAANTWLICTRCHAALTYGRLERSERQAEFVFYQRRRAARGTVGQLALTL